ncbi:hypothetical protein KL914_004815 [Ogataea haglerorum]|uniref:Hydantoinase n=1 Tax=Ogataea haglerorum TaxID=1937702 RepID=A0ABQ7RBB7_9ASCO|nr:hypothetical protein KL915_003857 [Ogataea haglerorum]KAG7703430.1 hypothetical protein KL914_004815 [Ogataea haglerorum]KAG7755144.1 hypothetical protein KL947_004638 [Ogataea haglerorum]KAG7762621.1 hypothetical protein KL946_004362 [Ogataea haglerorum]
MSKNLIIGIDVGGTNSDLVVLDPARLDAADHGVLAWHKSTTTPDVSVGIENAIKAVLEAPDSRFSKDQIATVTIGTTHFINAVIERDSNRLEKVAVLRLAGPYGRSSPPFSDFPEDLAEVINGYSAVLDGGVQVDGTEIRPLNESEIRQHCHRIKRLGLRTVVVVATFASVDSTHELRTAQIVREEIPGCDVVLSHRISGIGIIERENAAILNAAIKRFGRKIISSFIHATRRNGLDCSILLSQNDGTVLSVQDALETPVRTFSSGATNSMRGAAILCSQDPAVKGRNVIVCDVGGTTTDVGMLLASGFPRQSATYSYAGGVRINFSMPHVESIGLGGGSIVRHEGGRVGVGPDSTGAEIVSRGILFGGDTITASDVTIAKMVDEKAEVDKTVLMGDPGCVTGRFGAYFKDEFEKTVAAKLERVIDRMKTSPDDIPTIFVGGGSFIAPDRLKGTSKVIKPPFFQVANAVGAALGKMSSEVSEMRHTDGTEKAKQQTVHELTSRAVEACVAKGALRDSVEVVDVVSDAVPYVDNVYFFSVKVIGDVDYARAFESTRSLATVEYAGEEVLKNANVLTSVPAMIDYVTYKPCVRNGEWILSPTDIDFIGAGAYILGCGGGGNPSSSVVELKRLIRQGAEIKVVTLDEFSRRTGGKGTAPNVGYCGSPTISGERLHGDEMLEAFDIIERWEGKKADGVLLFEIGGGNGLSGLWTAYHKNVPCLDLDLMGRAYPTQWQSLPSVCHDGHGFPYGSLSDGNGLSLLITSAKDDVQMEEIIRDAMYHHGVSCACVGASLDVDRMVRETIKNPLSLAWRIGRQVFCARAASDLDNLPHRIIDACGGSDTAKCVFKGKILSVEKKLQRGYGYGVVELESVDGPKHRIRVPFKNENIVIYEVDEHGSEKPLCSVPDLITFVDMDGNAVGTQDYRYGLIVHVMVIAASDQWTTPKAVAVGGPKGFGSAFEKIEYVPVGKYVEPVPVCTEYNVST